jgi:hypothetical protein
LLSASSKPDDIVAFCVQHSRNYLQPRGSSMNAAVGLF